MITSKYNKWYLPSDIAQLMIKRKVPVHWKTSINKVTFCDVTHRAMYFIKKLVSEDRFSEKVKTEMRHLDTLTAQRQEVITTLNRVKGISRPLKMPWVPSDYAYPPFAPFQGEAIRCMTQVPYTMLQADCGLGKTYMTIHTVWALRWLAIQQNKKPPRALVICLRSLITGAWQDDVDKFGNDDLKMFNLRKYWKSRSKKKGLIPKDIAFCVANFGSAKLHIKELLAEHFDILIIDESSRCRKPLTATTQMVDTFSKYINTRYLLTATPIPNGIAGAWAQMKIMDGGATLGMSFSEFRHATHRVIVGGENKQDGTPNNVPEGQTLYFEHINGINAVAARMAPVVLRYNKDKVVDLPERTFIVSKVDASPEQSRLQAQMVNDLIAEIKDGVVITLENAIVRMGKLVQLTGGFIIDQEYALREDGSFRGKLHALKQNPKMDRLIDLLEGIDGQVLLWAWHKHEVTAIVDAIRKKKLGTVDFINGNVTDNQRDIRRLAFRSEKLKYLVANQKALGHGQTFVNTSYAIYYSNNFDAELRLQTRERIHRIGQKRRCFYTDIVMRNSIDEYILDIVEYKEGVQSYVMDTNKLMHTLKEIRYGNQRRNQ